MQAVQAKAEHVIEKVALPSDVITPRMLEALELYLWAERMGWDVRHEWTNTQRSPGVSKSPDLRLIADHFFVGQLAFVSRRTSVPYPDIAYRPALILGAEE